MSLTVKHVNSDASFLLTFRPILPFPASPGDAKHDFGILLDPWLTGPSKIFHTKFSLSNQTEPPCVSSISELPEPDLVVISQSKTDHCHKETLTQLPARGGKTLVLAEPAAAKTIKGWKHFDSTKLAVLPRWDAKQPDNIYRVTLPPLSPHGTHGEITITYLQQRGDITALHSAVCITYRPPTSNGSFETVTPPASSGSESSKPSSNRTLSVIYSPHGCSYKTLEPFVTHHLVQQAALPLSALLHCFDKVTNAWYLGGQICNGFPGGLEIAQKLFAKVWISAHDGDKIVKGVATTQIKVEKYDREEVESVISPRSDKFPFRRELGTAAVILAVGEEMLLSQSMSFSDFDDDTTSP